MSQHGLTEPVDRVDCDRLPIHTPGSIQPHGTLVVAHPADLTILQTAANTAAILGRTPEGLLGRPLDVLVGGEIAARIKLDTAEPEQPHLFDPLYLKVQAADGGCRPVSCLYHHYQGAVLVEFEPAAGVAGAPAAGLRWQLRAITRMAQAATVPALCAQTAAEIRALTGFDRVMVYRFEEDWQGEVLAESMADLPVSYLGLRFPASAIPEQARWLYNRNRLHAVADTGYRPVPLLPETNPLTGRPLDMSFAYLRSVAPSYAAYLRDLGVRASLTVSLLVEGRLWGLIVCHHAVPFHLAVAERIACQELGEIAASHLARLLAGARAQQRLRAQQACAAFRAAAVGGAGLLRALKPFTELFEADAMVAAIGSESVATGAPPEIFGDLEPLRRAAAQDCCFATDHLAAQPGLAPSLTRQFAGGLYIPLSAERGDHLFFARKEEVRTFGWGGDPARLAVAAADGATVRHPPPSRALWRETVHGRARRFSEVDGEAARLVRDAVLDEVAAEGRRRLEAALHESDARLRHLLTASATMVYSCEPWRPYPVTYVSDNIRTVLGYAPQELLEGPAFWADRIHPEDRGCVLGGLDGLFTQDHGVFEYRFRHKDGTWLWMRDEVSVIRDGAGRAQQLIGAWIDITAHKQAEQALAAKSAELERSNRELRQLAYIASHDLVEPLHRLQASGMLLLTDRRRRLAEEDHCQVEGMVEAARQMQALTAGLLAFARIETESRRLQRIELGEVIGEVRRDLAAEIAASGGRIEAGALPVLQADRQQMRQLFRNLIGNALKFRAPGRTPVVRIEAAERDGVCRVTVSDNGIGFDPQQAEHIFEPFTRLHPRRSYQGTGIGLALCRKIATGHGGTIAAEGRPGEGATVTVTLPVRQATP